MKAHRIASKRPGTRCTRINGKIWQDRTEPRAENTTFLKPSLQYNRRPSKAPGVHSIEIDSILLDVHVPRGSSRGSYLRPYLTVALCSHTRAILGWHLSLERPDWSTAAKLLRLPRQKRTAGVPRPRAQLDQTAWGIPKSLISDNHQYFSTEMVRALHRASIERTFADLVRTFTRRPSADRTNAAMTHDQLAELVRGWIDRQNKQLPSNTDLTLRAPMEIRQ